MSRIETAMEKAAQLRQQGALAARQQGGALPSAEPALGAPSPQLPPYAHRPTAVPSRYGTLSPDSPFLVNLHDPHSATAEEYRKLKSILVKMTTGAGFKNTVMVTSSVPSEGKSLTALNLALSLAQELDHTVLLVDADLRRPAVHRYLNVEQGVGLAEVLAGEAQLGDAIIPTGIGKLSIIRAGRSIDNPAEMFSSQHAKGVVNELKNRYGDRYVLFDTPPLLPFAESRSLAHLVDGVLFVVMERLASQENVREALDALKGTHLLGTVYNAALLDSSDVRYSYYRGYEKKK